MHDVAQSPLVLCLLIVVVGALASLVPVSPVEPVLVAVAAVAPRWLLVPIIILVTISHMATKMLIFVGGAKVGARLKGKALERFEVTRRRLAERPALQDGTLFLSSVVGLPPFYLITALCGTLRMPMKKFIAVATTGRAIRFAVLVFAPQLFRPAPVSAQPLPPAVRVAGAGAPTYVMLSGMIGGVASFRRLEVPLVARGCRVVSIDPYQLAIDSANVSFDAMAKLVDAELERRHITDAIVVGHSHGGNVGLRLAGMASGRVAALYLIDVGAMPDNRGAVFAASLQYVPIIARIPTGKAFIRHRAIVGLRETSAGEAWLDDSTRDAYTRPFLDNVDRVVAMAQRLAKAEEPERVADVIARVRIPVSVLLGEKQTKAGPKEQEFILLRSLGAGFRIDTIARTGHFPHEESPEAVLRLITRPPRVVALASAEGRP